MTTVGIIGFGSFGSFLADKLDSHVNVQVFNKDNDAGKWSASLETVAGADYLILAVPLSAYSEVINAIKSFLSQETVIVDVCSVKQEPIKIITKILPDQPVVSTHPLFGPESARNGLDGHTIVLCPEQSHTAKLGAVKQFCADLNLTIVEMTAEEHDKEMALVHGLTFFIAHGLKDLGLHERKITTPSFKKLVDLAELEKHHSDELFKTIQQGNPYSGPIRQAFIKELESVDKKISR